MTTDTWEQTDIQIQIDRYFLHHPEHESHPVAVFFRELIGEQSTYEQGYDDACEEIGDPHAAYEDGYVKGKEYQYGAALRLIRQSKTIEEAVAAVKGEQP